MQLNITLLNIILAVQACKEFELNKACLERCKTDDYSENVDYNWYRNVEKYFYNMDDVLTKKAGIKKNMITFERILSCKVPEEAMDTEYCELGKFQVFI